jgi:hypothetical protein
VSGRNRFELLDVVCPRVLVSTLPDRYVCARAARHLDGGAVAGSLDHGVVARPEQRVVGDEDAFLGGGERDDVVRAGLLVVR